MKLSKLLVALSIIAILGCSTKKQLPTMQFSTKQWYKGNLHTHSYWSDGDDFPEVIMDWYKSHDYQFVALTDHNTLAEGEKWKVIPPKSIFQDAFENYLETYGSEWVNYKIDSSDHTQVKLKTYKEYKGKFEEEEKFLIIQSEEITDQFDGKPLHMNATNVQTKIEAQGGNSVVEVMQNNIDAVIKQRDELDIPMIAHINHPNFRFAVSLEDMIASKNEQFFEVYNGHHMVNNSGDSTRISTERMWDLINISYIENNKPIMYGLATDDSHNYHNKGQDWSNAGRGWIEVRAESLSPRSLIDAMETGDFYASTGVELKDLIIDKSKIAVEVMQEEGVIYKIEFVGCKKGKDVPEVLMSINGAKASFELTDDLLFVRCKITSSKLQENPIENILYETAWTQPVQLTIDN